MKEEKGWNCEYDKTEHVRGHLRCVITNNDGDSKTTEVMTMTS